MLSATTCTEMSGCSFWKQARRGTSHSEAKVSVVVTRTTGVVCTRTAAVASRSWFSACDTSR